MKSLLIALVGRIFVCVSIIVSWGSSGYNVVQAQVFWPSAVWPSYSQVQPQLQPWPWPGSFGAGVGRINDETRSFGVDHRQKERCCTQHFKGSTGRCFDLTQCNEIHNGNGNDDNNGFGFGFGYQSRFGNAIRQRQPFHGTSDPELELLEVMCTCMEESVAERHRVHTTWLSAWGGHGFQRVHQTIGSHVCCEGRDGDEIRPTSKIGPVSRWRPAKPNNDHDSNKDDHVSNRMSLLGMTSKYTHTFPQKETQIPDSPKRKPVSQQETTTQTTDDVSVHALEWTPSIKAVVLSHRNLHLLPRPDSCGVARALESKPADYVIGGINSKFGAHPWLVLLGGPCSDRDKPDTRARAPPEFVFNCGGTLINSRYVLTAAHCVFRMEGPAAVARPQCNVTTLRIGEFDQSKDPDCDDAHATNAICAPPVQNIAVEEVFPHEGYNLQSRGNDIALIRLAEPAKLGTFVTPICLPWHDFVRMDEHEPTDANADVLTVAGWGRTVYHRVEGSTILQEVKVPIVGRTRCQKYFESSPLVVDEGVFCAGGERRRDSCHGDSGGPILGSLTMKPSRGGGREVTRKVELGIVSSGLESSECSTAGPGHLTLYTKVSHYLPWILDHIKP